MITRLNPNIKTMIALSETGLSDNKFVEYVTWENVHTLYEQGKTIVYEDTMQPVNPENFEKELNPTYKGGK